MESENVERNGIDDDAMAAPMILPVRIFSASVSSVFSSDLCSRVVEKFLSKQFLNRERYKLVLQKNTSVV